MASDLMQGVGKVVQEAMERWAIPGVAVGVLLDGEIHKAGYGVTSIETNWPVTPDTIFQIGSNSKIFTTTLLMTLVDDGKVNLDDPITKYLPDLKVKDMAALEKMTVRQTVSHQTGIHGDWFDDLGWGEDALEKSLTYVPERPQMYQPTELWSYTNINFNIAGRIIETQLGQSFEAAMKERVIDPLGLKRTAQFPWEVFSHPHAVGHRPENPGDDDVIVAREYWLTRHLNPAGGITSSVEDVLLFDKFHLGLGGGERDGKPILSEESRLAMQEPQITAANFAEHWGLGWWLYTVDGAKVVGHGGGTNGFITRQTLLPEHGVAWVILTNSAFGGALHRPVERWLLKNVAGLTETDPELVPVDMAQLNRLAGEYGNPNVTSTISVHDGGLRVQSRSLNIATGEETEMPPVDFQPIGDLLFMATEGRSEGNRIDFLENPDGSVRAVWMGGRLQFRKAE